MVRRISVSFRRKPWRPVQKSITREDVVTILDLPTRRYRLKHDWPRDRWFKDPAGTDHTDWGVGLPCEETYWNLVKSTDADLIGPNKSGREDSNWCGGFIVGEEPGDKKFEKIRARLIAVENVIGIRDRLAMTFALDYARKGDKDSEPTELSLIRDAAEPPDGRAPSAKNIKNADEIARRMTEFVDAVECYGVADSVVSVPPKNPNTKFHLADHLAKALAVHMSIDDATSSLRSIKPRPSVRNLTARERLNHLDGTISVDAAKYKDKIVLLVDDMYQSGTSMNYVAHLLYEAGATGVIGLSCLKALSNTDAIPQN